MNINEILSITIAIHTNFPKPVLQLMLQTPLSPAASTVQGGCKGFLLNGREKNLSFLNNLTDYGNIIHINECFLQRLSIAYIFNLIANHF